MMQGKVMSRSRARHVATYLSLGGACRVSSLSFNHQVAHLMLVGYDDGNVSLFNTKSGEEFYSFFAAKDSIVHV